MKPPPFAYHAPDSLSEAVALLGRLENARVLAGGQSLMPMLNMRFVIPDNVVDLNGVPDLDYIRVVGDSLEIGAMTRQRDIEFSEVVERHCPLLREAILNVGHRQTRNRGTIGGSLCHLDPAAELVSVAAALGATLVVTGTGGVRELAFEEFALGFMTVSLEPDEVLTAIRLPLWPAGHGHCFLEFARRHGDFAVVSVAAMMALDTAGRVSRVSLTLGGVGPVPVRIDAVERSLLGEAPSAALLADAAGSCRDVEAMEDVHASAAYRQQLAAVLSRRALTLCARRAGVEGLS